MFGPKKYKLLPAERVTAKDGNAYTLYRIESLVDIPLHGVKVGDKGGYVQNKGTLSHKGSCWVGGNAIALSFGGDKVVVDDALVTDEAFASGRVSGTSKVSGNARTLRAVSEGANVSGNAVVKGVLYGNINVMDNVYIETSTNIQASNNSEVTISGDVKIDAPSRKNKSDAWFIELRGSEKVIISGKLNLDEVLLRGNCILDGNFSLKNVTFEGDTIIRGTHQIKPHVNFSGTNVLTGTVMIPPGTHVHDVVMDSGVLDYAAPREPYDIVLPEPPSWENMVRPKSVAGAVFTPPMTVPETPSSSLNAVINEYVAIIAEVEAEYEAYTTDIVKLIKYPAMVDTSIPEVRDFVVALRTAKRAVRLNQIEKLSELASTLEEVFVNAENRVQTLVSSHLDEGKKKSLKTAEQMFKIACDDASPEPEKRLGYKAGMRSLEGVLVVSDKATENLKARIGILELEA